MKSTRLKFDNDTYRKQLAMSVGPGDYFLENLGPCQPCFPVDLPATHVGVGCTDKSLIDIDSELSGITRGASACPDNQYIPNAGTLCDSTLFPVCNRLIPKGTRFSNGPCTLRGTGWNRFQPGLCHNPQDKALMPFDTLINNRLLTKDLHRPCIVKPICNDYALPPPENKNIQYDWSS